MQTLNQKKITPQYAGMRVTPESYLKLEEDGFKYDMIDGVLHLAPSGSPEHSSTQSGMITMLGIHRRRHGGFKLFTEQDIVLPDGGDILRPDACVIMNERLEIVGRHVRGTPDLVVEILSRRTEKRDLGEKAERYLACGVREYWIMDPRKKSPALWKNRGTHWEKKRSSVLTSEVLPGFRIILEDIFD